MRDGSALSNALPDFEWKHILVEGSRSKLKMLPHHQFGFNCSNRPDISVL
jgi:hypothetical protein